MNLKLMAAAVAVAAVLAAPAAQAQAFINVLTGGTSGVYYPLGVAIGKIFGDKIPNVKTQVQATKASVENLILLQQGRGEIAFALGDSLKAAWEGDEEAGFKSRMDKLRTKRLDHSVGVATADYVVLRGQQDFELALDRLGLPMIVKPATQGSSVGMSKVEQASDLPAAHEAAARIESSVFAEAWIAGREYTVAVLQGRALPAIRIETPRTFYDYEAKYFRDDTRYFCPCGLSVPAEQHLANLAVAAFDAVGAGGWGRADFMMDTTGRPLLLEVNTIPGMTDHSLVPMAARAAGIDFDELAWRVLETSFARIRT